MCRCTQLKGHKVKRRRKRCARAIKNAHGTFSAAEAEAHARGLEPTRPSVAFREVCTEGLTGTNPTNKIDAITMHSWEAEQVGSYSPQALSTSRDPSAMLDARGLECFTWPFPMMTSGVGLFRRDGNGVLCIFGTKSRQRRRIAVHASNASFTAA